MQKTKYIALLRGINVGGKNRVSMAILKEAMINKGFINVVTYINSGNVVFESEETNKEDIKDACQNLIKETFDLNIPVCIITSQELADALKNQPTWWDAQREEKTVDQIIFLLPPLTVEEVYAALGKPDSEEERADNYKNAVFWSAKKEKFTKTKWSKISSTKIYSHVTIRNANTAKALLKICLRDE